MRDSSALELAFAGCNTTLSDAVNAASIQIDDYAAILDLLGEHLMESAAACLPSLIDQKTWDGLSASGQIATLREFMKSLSEPPPGRRHSKQPIAKRPMLPAEMGPWEGSKCLPSCFGMLVIMAAYARLTGTKALAASVQRMSAELVMPGMIDLFTTALRFTKRHFKNLAAYDELPGRLARSLADAKSAIGTSPNERFFHGAILFRITGGTWASLDPYMGNFALLKPPERPMDRAWSGLKNPADAASFRGLPEWKDLPKFTRQLGEILEFIHTALAGPLLTPSGSIQELARHVVAVSGRFDVQLTTWEQVIAFSMTTPPIWQVPDHPTAVEQATKATGDYQRQIQERILMILLHVWFEKVWASAQAVRSTQPHQAMMVSHVPRSLAVWALINLRHRTPGLLGADLLPYSNSDVVLLNALLDQSHGRTTPTEDRQIADLASIYGQTPDGMIHPLMKLLVA